MIVGNLITFGAGTALGWLPWQVSAIFLGLFIVLVLAFSRMIDWSEYGPSLAQFLPGLVVGAGVGLYLKRRRQ